ncbi:cytochrome d1, heme region [Pseudomonas sp. ATCC 13867]|uniref:cytochrome D1 domain-containing protein n=1 Tax=Pseudomonas sp. ATCC 13867 TaxID=1294143 RepID=UPI0002C4E970|nr:cytochrome D1 domain-containing protein [Pseudomonas sp. ATCC 13867]AGI25713.1 cytochrome d1, heme region [Pseudomonas sp. ATCC 13867]
MKSRLILLGLCLLLGAVQHGAAQERGTGDLALVVERASGSLQLLDTSARTSLGRIEGLGDLSHASLVYSRDQRHAFVFGRDGGLSKVDLLSRRVVARVQQAGNSIGGAISQDGRWVAVANYQPGGVRVFSSRDLSLRADIPATYAEGQRAKVVGIADVPGVGFAYSLFEAGEIWLTDLSDPQAPRTRRFKAGDRPYDGLVSPDGRWYVAGLFGEPGVAVLDLWHPERGVRKVLQRHVPDDPQRPVYKMPHLRGWAMAGDYAFLPAIGRHELVVLRVSDWSEVSRIPLAGQPVFAVVRPDQRQVWVNFALPDNDRVQVIDVDSLKVIDSLRPGKAVLHLEFSPRGEQLWLSARDDNRVLVYDSYRRTLLGSIEARAPSGIFMTGRAGRIGL